MNFLELAKKRYSVRKFSEEKVSPGDLELILEAGRVAPTGANRQPQRLLVIQSEEGVAKLSKATRLYGAPMAILICSDTSETWERPFDGKKLTDIDAAIITDHMMLEATDLGLGSLWICWFDPEIIRSEFALPDHLEPINILAIGHAESEQTQASSPDRHKTLRKPIEQTVFFEHL